MQLLSKLRIGLDCANGAASVVAPALFRQLGSKVRVWHAAPDGVNINQQCGAVYPAFLQQKVLEEKLDVGFAFDGDADRLIAIDHTGRVLDGDYLLAVCAQALLAEDQDASQRIVVSTVMANLGLEQALRQMGFELYRTPVGDKYVVEGMQQTGAKLGGEQSGHLVFLNHHTTGDGLLTAVQLLNAIAARQLPLAALAQILHKLPQIVLNVKIRERRDPLSLPQVQRIVEEAEHRLGHDGRVVVRLSGTESVARVMIEGPEQSLIESLAHRIGQANHERTRDRIRQPCAVQGVGCMQVATASEMRNIDQRTIELYRVPSIVLMENAGIQLLRFMQTRLSGLERYHVTIVTGRGNNGGDGFVLARHLWHLGIKTRVLLTCPWGASAW